MSDHLNGLSVQANGGLPRPPVLVPVSLSEIVATALAATEVPPEARLTVSVRDTAVADPVGLTRVVTNLLTNAFRYGGPHVDVTTRVARERIALTIADDGPGVPKPLQRMLFDRVTRGVDTNGHGALGNGLRVSRDLVQSYGGTLTYEPAVPSGSRFTIHLALAPIAQRPHTET